MLALSIDEGSRAACSIKGDAATPAARKRAGLFPLPPTPPSRFHFQVTGADFRWFQDLVVVLRLGIFDYWLQGSSLSIRE